MSVARVSILSLLLLAAPAFASGASHTRDLDTDECILNLGVVSVPSDGDCRAFATLTLTVTSCDQTSCRYTASGTATFQAEADLFPQVSTNIFNMQSGAPFTCHAESATFGNEVSCAGSVPDILVHVAPGACKAMLFQVVGVAAVAPVLGAPFLYSVGDAEVADLCRAADGAPYIVG